MIVFKRISLWLFMVLIFNSAYGQKKDVYELKTNKEATYLGIGIALAGTGIYLLKQADKSNIEEIELLDPEGLWSIDRVAVDNYSSTAQTASDIILYSAATLPFLTYNSGHASTTAAFSFFTAQVLTDLHPNWKNKYIIWATAASIPAAISFLRMRAGKHFATDVITGYLAGATIGYLVPMLHRKESNLKASLSFNGMNFSYKF